jgi:NAD(P)-dependent dehydrogenase (short-subunit alcohol dehydrogenase family)
MRRIFITGSSDGLGFLAGKLLLEQGHKVVLHARSETKARLMKDKLPDCEAVVVGDVSTLKEMKSIAEQVNKLGRFDSVIHNVGVYTTENRNLTADGLTQLFAVNVVAPYVLTALIDQPERLIYLSSDMHTSGDENLDDPQWEKRSWNSSQAYSDSKLYDLMLSKYLARRWPQVNVNAVNPGWVPTKMGGQGAPDNLIEGATTQVWLAASDEAQAKVSGHYFFHQKSRPFKQAASRPELQERLIQYLEERTGIRIALDDSNSR